MKKKIAVFLAAVACTGLLAACRRDPMYDAPVDTTAPLNTVRPTVPRTEPSTVPEYTAVTLPRETEATRPTATEPDYTVEDGNGPTPGQMSSFQF